MIKDNKVSKYFLYAIGEIILVVIGILIALSINNWNENNKAKSRLKSDLLELKSELNSDLIRLNSVLIQLKVIDEKGMYLLDFLAQKLEIVDSVKVQEAFVDVATLASFGKSNTAYDNLINNGNYQLVENKTLKEKLGFFHNTRDWYDAYHNGPLLESYYQYVRIIHKYAKPGFVRKTYEAAWPKKNEVIANEIHNNSYSSNIDFNKLIKANDILVLLDQVQLSRYVQIIQYSIIKSDIEELILLIDYEINVYNY